MEKVVNKQRIDLFENGFCMTFQNGFTASVRWGKGLYCDRLPNPNTLSSAKNVEVAIYHPKGHFYKDRTWIPEDDDVRGWIWINEIPQFLKDVKELRE